MYLINLIDFIYNLIKYVYEFWDEKFKTQMKKWKKTWINEEIDSVNGVEDPVLLKYSVSSSWSTNSKQSET